MTSFLPRLRRLLLTPAVLLSLAGSLIDASADEERTESTPSLPVYQPRFGRTRPVIAIVGENSGTELSDFAIPYGVLRRAHVAEVFTVSTQPGVLRMRPALRVQADATIAEFDARFPEGADYVIVPAVVKFRDPALLAWLKSQGAKGSTLMSICDGAAVVAGTGLMDGHRATAHWASAKNRRKLFPNVNWVADVRYLSDGKIISTAGISAALPASPPRFKFPERSPPRPRARTATACRAGRAGCSARAWRAGATARCAARAARAGAAWRRRRPACR